MWKRNLIDRRTCIPMCGTHPSLGLYANYFPIINKGHRLTRTISVKFVDGRDKKRCIDNRPLRQSVGSACAEVVVVVHVASPSTRVMQRRSIYARKSRWQLSKFSNAIRGHMNRHILGRFSVVDRCANGDRLVNISKRFGRRKRHLLNWCSNDDHTNARIGHTFVVAHWTNTERRRHRKCSWTRSLHATSHPYVLEPLHALIAQNISTSLHLGRHHLTCLLVYANDCFTPPPPHLV